MRHLIMQLILSVVLASCAAAQTPLTIVQVRPDGDLMALPVTIAGTKQWFMWDTGAPSLVIDPRLSRDLGLKAGATDSVTGTGTGSVAISHAEPIRVAIGSQSYVINDPWIIDLSGVPIAKDIRGLVGADLWSRYAVRMNSQRRTIELFAAGSYRPDREEVALPLIVENNKMYVDVVLAIKPGLTVTQRVRVDTGSEEFVNAPIVGQALETRRSILGNGLGENFEAVSGRMQAVAFGPFTIRDAWGPAGKGPSMGMEMLRRFIVTFDAGAGKIYLRPTPALNDPVPPPPQLPE